MSSLVKLKIIVIWGLSMSLLAVPCISVAAMTDAQAILAASDKVRNPGAPFSLYMELVEYRQEARTAENHLEVFSKIDGTSGRFNTLVRFHSPPRDANKLMLKVGNELWFYDPQDKASIRISPQQRLLGQAANGDVITANLTRDYVASLDVNESIKDGDGASRLCHKLSLDARASDVTYSKISLWIDASNSWPIKGEFYTGTGQRLKTVYYRRYRSELGAMRPTEVVIFDGLNSGLVTVMRYTDYRWRDIPDLWFQRDFLPRFNFK